MPFFSETTLLFAREFDKNLYLEFKLKIFLTDKFFFSNTETQNLRLKKKQIKTNLPIR